MDYDYFHALKPDQAKEFLSAFLRAEGPALESLQPLAAEKGICFDFRLDSLPEVLKWFMGQVHFQYAPLTDDTPQWIRQAHPHGVIAFDDESRALILRASFYLGESFARCPGLRWATGNIEYVQKHMPVVTGFLQEDELPPLSVVENLFSRILERGAPATDIDRAINVWRNRLP